MAEAAEPFDRFQAFTEVKEAGEYLQRAAEADETAAKTSDLTLRRQWTDLADQWRTLARQSGLFAGEQMGNPSAVSRTAAETHPPQKL